MTVDKYCTRCGTELALREADQRVRPTCPACGYVAYGHSSIGVGGLLFHAGKFLLIQRAQNPGQGLWTLPSGYVEVDETIEAALVREMLEETGLQTRPLGIFTIRDRLSQEHHNLYCVFGLALDGPIEDLRVNGDGIEIAQAGLLSLVEIDRLERVSPYTRWCIQNYRPGRAGLQRVPADQYKDLRLTFKDLIFGYSE